MNADETAPQGISQRIIGCGFAVANTLGPGFLEKVYENALAYELRTVGLTVAQQQSAKVVYKGLIVGEYVTDLLVERSVMVEVKAVRAFDEVPRAQCINYLRCTGSHLCLLLNFGRPGLEIKRIAWQL